VDSEISRRDVLKAAIGVAAAAGLSQTALAQNANNAAQVPKAASSKPFIGIQMDPASVHKDMDGVLDHLQKDIGVNALFPFAYNYDGLWSGLPRTGFRGGNFSTPHMQFYDGSGLTYADMRSPDFGDYDLLANLIPAAKKRGMKTFAWIYEDVTPISLPAWQPFFEVDYNGKPATTHPAGVCNNNPQFRAYLLGLVEDYARSYDIDGIMWGQERQGGFLNSIGAFHHAPKEKADGKAGCFCEFCLKKAKDLGLDAEGARQGFIALSKYVLDTRAGKRPRDGYFVEFFRVLMNHPQLLAWENLWWQSRLQLQRDIYQKAKSIKPTLQVGWHIWHNVSFSPFHRAEMDYAAMAPFSDFLKVVVYNNCGGERMASFVESMCTDMFGDLPREQATQMFYKILGYEGEATFDKLAPAGLSPDYVKRETQRALSGVAGTSTQVWPGIDIDVRIEVDNGGHCTPDGVKQAVLAALQDGAPGVLLSRMYYEMKPENLAGAGAAMKELGFL
jgi:hypothetical protein